MKIPKIFKPEDFDFHSDSYFDKKAADIAQEILEREADKWPVIYGNPDNELSWNDSNGAKRISTHQALLAFPQPIEKEEPKCEHKRWEIRKSVTQTIPVWTESSNRIVCLDCDEEIIPEWKVKE